MTGRMYRLFEYVTSRLVGMQSGSVNKVLVDMTNFNNYYVSLWVIVIFSVIAHAGVKECLNVCF